MGAARRRTGTVGKGGRGVDDHLQCGQHVSGGDAIDANAGVSPLNGEGGSEMSDSGLGGVVRPIDKVSKHAGFNLMDNPWLTSEAGAR